MIRQSERGSILVFILIGIALFAALSYAVTSGIRLSSGDMSLGGEEKMNIALSELREAALQSRTALQMMVSEGNAIDRIDVSASGSSGSYYSHTNNLCLSDKCKLYNPAGGGLTFFVFSKTYPQLSSSPNIITGHPQGLFWAWWAYKGTLQADVIYRVEITKPFCNFINKKNGITADIDSFTATSVATKQYMDGVFNTLAASDSAALAGDTEASYLMGKSDGCFLMAGSPNQYIYVAFIYAR